MPATALDQAIARVQQDYGYLSGVLLAAQSTEQGLALVKAASMEALLESTAETYRFLQSLQRSASSDGPESEVLRDLRSRLRSNADAATASLREQAEQAKERLDSAAIKTGAAAVAESGSSSEPQGADS